jgi:hypothetical protein
MRTTLTIDSDVSAMIEKLRREGNRSLKEIINDALRRGLLQAESSSTGRQFRQRTLASGRCRLANLDDIAEILTIAEGEHFR